jgi:hypothetical protein
MFRARATVSSTRRGGIAQSSTCASTAQTSPARPSPPTSGPPYFRGPPDHAYRRGSLSHRSSARPGATHDPSFDGGGIVIQTCKGLQQGLKRRRGGDVTHESPFQEPHRLLLIKWTELVETTSDITVQLTLLCTLYVSEKTAASLVQCRSIFRRNFFQYMR